MAPEVLKGKTYTTASDVYSFAVVMWEILARKKPYRKFKSLDQLRNGICKHSYREKIPSDWPIELIYLIETCWKPEPTERKTFPQILEALENILIELSIQDKDGCLLWKDSFMGHSFVPWNKFVAKFRNVSLELHDGGASYRSFLAQSSSPGKKSPRKLSYSQKSPRMKTVMHKSEGNNAVTLEQEKCMRVVLGLPLELSQTDVVSMEAFGLMLRRFGPLYSPRYETPFLERLRVLLQHKWFHGAVNTRSAEKMLEGRSHGSFLVRFSNRRPGNFTVTRKSSTGQAVHQRIEKKGDQFSVFGTLYNSLSELMEEEYSRLGVSISIPGSPYEQIFNKDDDAKGKYTYENRELERSGSDFQGRSSGDIFSGGIDAQGAGGDFEMM